MKEDIYITFGKYLNNELSETEFKSFEERLKTDSEFQEDFNIYKALESSLSSKYQNEEATKELRTSLSDLGNQFIKKETKVLPLIRYKTLMVAASIALLIGFFLFNNGDPVYSDFSNHNTLELVVRSEGSEKFSKAEEAFNTKSYKEALELLTQILNDNLNDVEVQLYKGICFLELNSFVDADIIFDTISNGNSSFKNTATWYKALSMLKQEQFEACKYVLKTIPKSAEEYKQAKKLMRKL